MRQANFERGPGCSEVRMRISLSWLRRQISGCFLLALTMAFIAGAASAQQAINSRSSAETSSQAQAPTAPLPDSPGSVRLQIIADNQLASAQQPAPEPRQNNTQPQAGAQPQAGTQQQTGTQQPVGTAASESVKATGVAASQPAGAAIAPAKQRRTRSILIKVGALVGAGVAIGTVVGLSAASPSRPR